MSILIAILSVLFAALQYFSIPRSSLQAVVHGYPYHHFTDQKKLDDNLVQHELQHSSLLGENFFEFNGVSGVYEILLLNRGNTAAKNVRIFIKYAKRMVISRNSEKSFVKGDEVNIGNVNPNEEIKVISWTSGSAKLYRSFAPDISITHDNGVVKLDHRYEIEGIFRTLHGIKFILYGTIWGLLGVLMIFMNIFKVSVRQSTHTQKVPSNDKNEL